MTKLNATGTALVYSTYLGGSATEGGAIGIAVDSVGNAYVTGGTTSTDFPTSAGAFQTALAGGSDAFVTKLNAAGSALIYSTYLGGTGHEGGFFRIALDAAGNAYVAGHTDSADFPITPGAFQSTFVGNVAAYVTKLDPAGSALVYSTYLGGSSIQIGGSFFKQTISIAVDSAGNAHVAGGTTSNTFPTTPGAFQPVFGGGLADAYVTKFDATGSALLYSTYLGGGGFEQAWGIALDVAGNAYVTGSTSSNDFPVSAAAFDTVLDGNSDAFVTKLNATGSALAYSTYLGGSLDEGGAGIAVNSLGEAHVTGSTTSMNFPVTAGAPQTAFGGGFTDSFITKLNASGAALVYSTYLGGTSDDDGFGIALDAAGNAYVTGQTSSTNFPTTPGAFQTSFGGVADAFVVKLGEPVVPPPAQTAGKVTGGGSISVAGGIGTFGFNVQARCGGCADRRRAAVRQPCQRGKRAQRDVHDLRGHRKHGELRWHLHQQRRAVHLHRERGGQRGARKERFLRDHRERWTGRGWQAARRQHPGPQAETLGGLPQARGRRADRGARPARASSRRCPTQRRRSNPCFRPRGRAPSRTRRD